MKKHSITAVVLLSLLAGCASKEQKTMPVNIYTAEQENKTRTEIIPIKQVIRPADVLDVIFHLDTMSKQAYRIQPGDQIDITFLTVSELSGSRLVMPDGSIELPYVGAINIGGLTTTEAHKILVERYKTVIKTPEIILTVPRPMAQLDNLRTSLTHPSSGMGREILVGADGRASFPLIGSMSLQGLTIDEVSDKINKLYANEFGQIRADVLLKATAPNQVYVLGEVAQPGAYPITRPVSVLEAITMARGSTRAARLDSAIIMRRNGDEAVAHVYNMKEAISREALQLAYLQPDDLLYIPQTRLSKAAQISREIADVILFQGFSYSFSYRVDNKNTND